MVLTCQSDGIAATSFRATEDSSVSTSQSDLRLSCGNDSFTCMIDINSDSQLHDSSQAHHTAAGVDGEAVDKSIMMPATKSLGNIGFYIIEAF